MKIIINESQLRLIVENEDKNLLDFTKFIDFNPNKWDEMFLHLNKKKGGIYDGYYINEDVDLYDSDVTELNYLVKVEGHLDLFRTPIKSLLMLSYVGGDLDLFRTPIKSLPMLSYVGGYLNLSDSGIEELPELKKVGTLLSLRDSQIKSLSVLKSVGGDLDLIETPLSEMTTEEELEKQINVKGHIYL